MRPCPASEELDGYAFEELSPLTAAQVALHLQDCAACEQELSWLRAEREALSRRTQQRDALPARALFQQLESRLPPASSSTESSWRGQAFAISALCFAWLLLAPARSFSGWSAGRSALSEPSCLSACVDDAARVESQMSACLIATPLADVGCLDLCR